MHSSRYEVVPSGSVLLTLTLLWAAVLTGAVLLGFAAWPTAPTSNPPPPGPFWTSFGLALGEALEREAPRVVVYLSGIVVVPLAAFTWIALPANERRTVPWIAGGWALLSLSAYADWWPSADVARFGMVCLPALLSAEILRSLFTALVRHASGPPIPAR